MAEIDQGIGEHAVDHAEVHGDDPAEAHDMHFAASHGLDYGVDAAEDHAVDHGEVYDVNQAAYLGQDLTVDHATGLGEDHNVGYEMDPNAEHEYGHGLDHEGEHGLEHSIDNPEEHDVEHAVDQVPENIQGQENQGHDEGTHAESGEKKWPGWPGESVFRMLVPAQKVGSIIGRRGEFIKKMVEETRARIKILDGPPGTTERAVLVSGKEEPDSPLPPAVNGLLTIHKRIINGLEADSTHASSGQGVKVSTRLLVPASQAGSLIGKQGATVKAIQEAATCLVRVLGQEDLPVFALQDDRIVEVAGEPANVEKALELIAAHLRKFLVDRSIIPVFEMQMQMSNRLMEHMPPHQSWGPPQGLPPNAGGGPGFGHNPQYMPPPRQLDNYYPPPDMPPLIEKQSGHQGISAYGRDAPMAGTGNAQAAPSMITQITQQMQIPLSYADAVIGTAGTSISYIRRASGATVTIQETRGVPGEMTAEVSGTASQVQTAQQLIQNFIAEAAAAAAPTQTQTGGSTDQGYNPYSTHGSMYASTASNQGYSTQTGGYANYGY